MEADAASAGVAAENDGGDVITPSFTTTLDEYNHAMKALPSTTTTLVSPEGKLLCVGAL